MAGDWIKMRTDLWTDPHIVRISSACNADRLRVIGALFRLWCLADTHTEDGFLAGYTTELIDSEVGFPGFARSAYAAGWLDVSPEGVTVPRFTEHNGRSAKRRAQESSRKKTVRKTSAFEADKMRTREEKRREEKRREEKEKKTSSENDEVAKPPSKPFTYSDDFTQFWQAYPRGRRVGKKAAFEEWKKALIRITAEKGFERAAAVAHLLDAVRTFTASPAGEGDPKYIPHPERWLKKGRYNDDRTAWEQTSQQSGSGTRPHSGLGVDHDPDHPLVFE